MKLNKRLSEELEFTINSIASASNYITNLESTDRFSITSVIDKLTEYADKRGIPYDKKAIDLRALTEMVLYEDWDGYIVAKDIVVKELHKYKHHKYNVDCLPFYRVSELVELLTEHANLLDYCRHNEVKGYDYYLDTFDTSGLGHLVQDHQEELRQKELSHERSFMSDKLSMQY